MLIAFVILQLFGFDVQRNKLMKIIPKISQMGIEMSIPQLKLFSVLNFLFAFLEFKCCSIFSCNSAKSTGFIK